MTGLGSIRFEKEVATQAAEFIFTSMMKYIAEVDIVVLGLKLCNDLVQELSSSKYLIFKVCLDSIEFYAPLSPPHRPRPIPKSRSIVDPLAQSVLDLMGNKFNINFAAQTAASAATMASETGQQKESKQEDAIKKDNRGRLELVSPNLRTIIDNNIKKKQGASPSPPPGASSTRDTFTLPSINGNNTAVASYPNTRPTSRAGTALTDYTTSTAGTSSRPTSRNEAGDTFDADALGAPANLNTTSVSTKDSDLPEGYRLVKSIAKGHFVSKKEWKGTSGKIGK